MEIANCAQKYRENIVGYKEDEQKENKMNKRSYKGDECIVMHKAAEIEGLRDEIVKSYSMR